METQKGHQTLMEKLITEIDTKNSWGKNQLVETTINIYKGVNVSNNELIVFSNFIATISTKNSWGKNDAKFTLLNLLAKQI